MTAPTHFLQDIMRQPAEMQRTIDHLRGQGQSALREAGSIIRNSRHVFLTGIGASWNAALSAGTLFSQAARPVYMQEAGELLHFTTMPRESVLIAISRSGRSIEIVQLLAKAKASGAKIIGVTNAANGELARESDVALVVPAAFDHAISVNTYSSLLLAASAIASEATTGFESVATPLLGALQEVADRLALYQDQLAQSGWLATQAHYYFLARGSSLATCHEARLLWEEAVKMPATAMSTSGFRHGPQEIVTEGMRFCICMDHSEMREQDFSVAHDLRELGASVMLIGENVVPGAAELVIQLPSSPRHWQSVIDIFPIQLAAERLARMRGVDCDSFRISSYVVEGEHGLVHKKAEASPNAG